eukprot:CAMPEP_0206269502 /NCGR_PEP_ID=MMETSP0047_2-20121206/32323_1 /ASSEMBLY_ACC=CAM_ASM_000192 /TAXON_ID=195065 /ORGANISM="Chroomonas mesostigmatica_cf, Strain CCMP1168" /LENGTH=60 /DNA_ID=CAMNT_0053697989 /DNA_START=252 /DNA_END=431 /DNA_ORIENTATION=-
MAEYLDRKTSSDPRTKRKETCGGTARLMHIVLGCAIQMQHSISSSLSSDASSCPDGAAAP